MLHSLTNPVSERSANIVLRRWYNNFCQNGHGNSLLKLFFASSMQCYSILSNHGSLSKNQHCDTDCTNILLLFLTSELTTEMEDEILSPSHLVTMTTKYILASLLKHCYSTYDAEILKRLENFYLFLHSFIIPLIY